MSLRIYTVYHEVPTVNDLPPNDSVNVPFVVGPAGRGCRPEHRDEGVLPATFAGMRCQHDVWTCYDKHAPLPDYLGFQSYRRRFVAVPAVNFDIAIMSRMFFRGKTIGEQYVSCHRAQDWKDLVGVLSAMGDVTGVDNLWLAPCCHWVIRRDLFVDFMHFWWVICARLLTIIEVPTEGYQTRLFDFLSDRIFTIWLVRLQLNNPKINVIDIPIEFLPHGIGPRNEMTAV